MQHTLRKLDESHIEIIEEQFVFLIKGAPDIEIHKEYYVWRLDDPTDCSLPEYAPLLAICAREIYPGLFIDIAYDKKDFIINLEMIHNNLKLKDVLMTAPSIKQELKELFFPTDGFIFFVKAKHAHNEHN
jgi:hypothetical protein